MGVRAQRPYTTAVPSPNASGLGVYGEIPVSYFTGIPNISIPLYEIKGTDINVPISLSYHAGGVTVEQQPTWVGLGWNLSAGGIITRIIKGYPDELLPGAESSLGSVKGYYTNINKNFDGDNWACKRLTEICNFNGVTPQEIEVNNVSDFEADEFNFNVNNISGKFYFDHTGEIQVQCDRLVRVIFNREFCTPFRGDSRTSRSFKGFVIIDDQGNKYYFGDINGGSNSIEYSYNKEDALNNHNDRTFSTSWYLTKVVSARGTDTFNFQYQRGPFLGNFGKGMSHTCESAATKDQSTKGVVINALTLGKYGSLPEFFFKCDGEWTVSGFFVSPVYLKSISYNNNNVASFIASKSTQLDYSYDTCYNAARGRNDMNSYSILKDTSGIEYWRTHPCAKMQKPPFEIDNIVRFQLDSLYLQSSYNTDHNPDGVHVGIKFSYSQNAGTRLFLEKISMHKGFHDKPSFYNFYYQKRDFVPRYTTTVGDHYGYNNRIGFPSGNSSSIDSLRKIIPEYVDAGALCKITYPTGGYSLFTYEVNDFSKVVNTDNRQQVDNSNGVASGLRISSIASYDSAKTNNPVLRRYYYKLDYLNGGSNSSGVLNIKPCYSIYIKGEAPEGFIFGQYSSSSPVFPLTINNQNNCVGYSEVTEGITDARGQTSFIVRKFTNHDNGYVDDSASCFLKYKGNSLDYSNYVHYYNSRNYERGRLLGEYYYNQKKDKFKEIIYSWARLGDRNYNSIRSVYFGIQLSIANVLFSSAYQTYTYPFVLSQKTERFFDLKNSLHTSKVTDYSYNYGVDHAHFYPVREEVNRSDGKRTAIEYTYVDDILNKSSLARRNNLFVAALDSLKSLNIVSKPLERRVFVNSKCIGSELVCYTLNSGYPVASSYYKLKTAIPLDDYVQFHLVENRNELMPMQDTRLVKYESYDSFNSINSPTQIVSKDGIARSYIWGYGGKLPVVVAENMLTSELKLGNNSIDSIAQATDSSKINRYTRKLRERIGGTNQSISSYTFQDGYGITSKTDSRGVTEYYRYDDFGRLVQVKDDNYSIKYQYAYKYHTDKTPENVSYGNSMIVWKLHNDCLKGGIPMDTLLYKVPAGKYEGETVEYANGLAHREISDEGQALANRICRCIYYSESKMSVFTRNNCGVGGTATSVRFELPTKAFSSTISQKVADSLAQDYIDKNGQAYANSMGVCTYSSAYKSINLSKKSCKDGSTISNGLFQVPAGRYTSTVSQQDADSKADAEIATAMSSTCIYGNNYIGNMFWKNDCSPGMSPGYVVYSVPPGKYVSLVSEDDANLYAKKDMDTYGQVYSNKNGICYYLNLDWISNTFSSAGHTCSNLISTNATWTLASPLPSWIKLNTQSGNGTLGLTVEISENVSSWSRTGSISITTTSPMKNQIVKTFTVIQEGRR